MCGKVFRLNPRYSTSTWERQRFCSKSCAGKHSAATFSDIWVARLKEWREKASRDTLEEVAKKISEARLGRNRTKVLERGCENCGIPIFYMKTPKGWIKEVDSAGNPKGNRGYLSFPPKFCSLSCGTTFRNLMSNPMNNVEARVKHSRHMVEFYSKHPELHPNYLMGRRSRGNSSLERKMCEVLKMLSIQHAHQYQVGQYWVDFAIPEHLLLIECDGRYWHQDRSRDAQRDSAILRRLPNWKLVHLNEDIVSWLFSRRNELSFANLIPGLGVINIEN